MEVCYWALLFMPLATLHHLLNISVQLANKRRLKKQKNKKMFLQLQFQLQLNLIYDRRSISQSVLLSGALLGPVTNFLSPWNFLQTDAGLFFQNEAEFIPDCTGVKAQNTPPYRATALRTRNTTHLVILCISWNWSLDFPLRTVHQRLQMGRSCRITFPRVLQWCSERH
jgi:hypothetical protein